MNITGTVTLMTAFRNFFIHLLLISLLLAGTSQLSGANIVQDLPDDTFGANEVIIDILSVNIEYDSNYLYLEYNFSSPVSESDTGNPFDLFGYIDLDVDQNQTTGTTALSDYYNGTSEIGMDYYLELMPDSTPGFIAVKDSDAKFIEYVPIAFDTNSFIVTIPLSIMNYDDGLIDCTAFFGDSGGPDDVIPNQGFITNKGSKPPEPIDPPPKPPAKRSSGGGGGGCFIDSATHSSNNTPVSIVLLLSGLFFAGCVVIIKKNFDL